MIGTPSVMKNNRSALGTLLVHRIATVCTSMERLPLEQFLRRMLSQNWEKGHDGVCINVYIINNTSTYVHFYRYYNDVRDIIFCGTIYILSFKF